MASMKGQRERAIETAGRPLASARTSTAARQCEAWLSPTSAIVSDGAAPAAAGRRPNLHGYSSSVRPLGSHGALGSRAASSGAGKIRSRREGSEQRLTVSRDAAPKHGRCVIGSGSAAGS